MILGTLTTTPLEDHTAERTSIGQFVLTVEVEDKVFLSTGDKRGFVNKTIGFHLASAIKDTEVPAQYWGFMASSTLMKEFNFPRKINFGAVR